jgi:hypothetical protein
MHIDRSHHVDASEPDASGMYSYYYEYDLYRFTDGNECLIARSYTDSPTEAHFLALEVSTERRGLQRSDLSKPIFRAAVGHFQSEGKVQLKWLGGSQGAYEALPQVQV